MKKETKQTSADFFENRTRLILILLALGTVLRIIVLQQWNSSLFHLAVWSDAATYNQWARSIITSGDWIDSQPFFMTPVYPYILAVIYSVTGENLIAVRIVQHLLGLATVLLLFLSGEKLFSRREAFFAAIIASLYGPLYLHANLLLVETVKVFLLTASFYCVLQARSRKDLRWWIGAGVLLGFTVLSRPSDLLVAAAVIVWIFYGAAQISQSKIRASLAVLLAVTAVIVPVTLRNYAVSQEFIPVTSNGGLNFYLGNNPKAVGVYYNVDGLDLANDPDGRVFLETMFGKEFSPGQASSYWMKEAIAFITQQPADALLLLGKKLLLFFHHREIGQLGYDYRFIAQNAVPLFSYLLTFIVLFPIAAVGMASVRTQWREHSLLYAFLIAEILSVILFFVTDRFRISAIPFFALFAGIGLDRLISSIRQRHRTALITAGAVIVGSAGLATVLNIPIKDDFSMEHEYLGMNFFDMKQYERALYEYRQAAQYKETFHLHNNVGNVYAAAGNIPKAMSEYQRGWEINPRQAISVFSMGTAYVRVQQFDSALVKFELAKRINPRFAPAYLNAGLALWYQERYDEALKNLEQYVTMEPDKGKTASVLRDIANLRLIIAEEKK